MRILPISLIIFNTVGVVCFANLWFSAPWGLPAQSGAKITELDRREIIDVEKLEAYQPQLVPNLRYDLAAWIAGAERAAAYENAVTGFVVSLMNVIGAGGWLYVMHRRDHSA
jgi:hypothetical protein